MRRADYANTVPKGNEMRDWKIAPLGRKRFDSQKNPA